MNKLFDYISKNKIEIVFLFLVLIFAFLVRIVGIYNHHHLWTDELYSLYFAEQSSVFNVVKELFLKDLHAPLYFIILHFWSMLYHNSNFMLRFLGVIFHFIFYVSFFYCVKDIFNKKTAYFATAFASISGFFIYHSLEVRHYSLIPLLSLLASYFFVKFLQEKTKRNTILFILFDILLLSTFNIAFIFVFAQFIVGFLYLYLKNKAQIKNYILTFLIIGVFYIPSLIMVFHGFYIYSNSTFQLLGNLHAFYPLSFIYFFLEGFACVFYRYTNMNVVYDANRHFIPILILCAFLPMIIFLSGILCGFLKKCKTFILFVMPSIMFILIIYFLACGGKTVLLQRYLLIAYPMIIASSIYGLTLIDKRKIGTILLSLWLALNFYSIVCISHFSPIRIRYDDTSGILSDFLKTEKFSSNDYILFVHSGMLYKRYIDASRYIELDANFISFPKDEKTMRLFLPDRTSDEILSIKDNSNRYDTMLPYFKQSTPSLRLRKYLAGNYFSNMKVGDRVFVVMDRAGAIEGLYHLLLNIDTTISYKPSLHYLTLLKAELDIISICVSELEFEKNVFIEGKPNGGTRIQIYKKTSATPRGVAFSFSRMK